MVCGRASSCCGRVGTMPGRIDQVIRCVQRGLWVTGREYIGHGATAADAVAHIPGVVVKGSANPNRIVIEAPPDQLQPLREKMGQTFLAEPGYPRSFGPSPQLSVTSPGSESARPRDRG